MKQRIIITTLLALVSQITAAGPITDTYTTGDTLTATKMDNIKAAINDNDIRINTNATDIGILQSNKSAAESNQVDVFSSKVLTTNNLTTVSSITITAPSNGIILVLFSAFGRLIHPSINGNNDNVLTQLQYAILTDDTGTIIPQFRQIITLPVTSSTGAYDLSMSSNRTFTVSSQGQYTFHVRAKVTDHPSTVGQGFFHTVMNPTMQAVFIPQ